MAKKSLSKKQKELAEGLVQTGMRKNTAKTLAFIAGVDETKSTEIQKATGLKQPEVSISIQELRKRDWVTKRDIKKKGKGRPVHGYSLAMDLTEIITELEKEESEKIKGIEDNLDNIKKLASSL